MLDFISSSSISLQFLVAFPNNVFFFRLKILIVGVYEKKKIVYRNAMLSCRCSSYCVHVRYKYGYSRELLLSSVTIIAINSDFHSRNYIFCRYIIIIIIYNICFDEFCSLIFIMLA